jgi:hypothetical protein
MPQLRAPDAGVFQAAHLSLRSSSGRCCRMIGKFGTEAYDPSLSPTRRDVIGHATSENSTHPLRRSPPQVNFVAILGPLQPAARRSCSTAVLPLAIDQYASQPV